MAEREDVFVDEGEMEVSEQVRISDKQKQRNQSEYSPKRKSELAVQVGDIAIFEEQHTACDVILNIQQTDR